MEKYYMKKAIDLAKLGWGRTRPNPLVGAVIVKDGDILSEGYHHVYGGDHAEIDALKKLNFSAEDATIYVNLEPCCHVGKTPSCVESIIKSKIKKVVIALQDPNPLVAGKGIKELKDNGIEVVTEILEEEARKLNEVFIKHITKREPFCILKTAMTLDGKIASVTGDSKWITDEDARKYVHHIRNGVAGIMVGIGTVLKDNPLLNTRIPNMEVRHPLRIIVDSNLRIPITSKVIRTVEDQPTLIATTTKACREKVHQLESLGVKILVLENNEGQVDLKELMKKLGEINIDSLLLEGGGNLNYSALETGIVDKVLYFIAPKIIGGKDAITSVEGRGKISIKDAFLLENMDIQRFQNDILIEGYIRKER